MDENKKVIFVVEDEKPLLEAIRLKLFKNNFEPVTARTIDQAKEYITTLPKVDVIWLDHYLLGKDNGLDLVTWCKDDNNPKYNNIPIFVVSNTTTHDKLVSYMALGVNGYFVKSNHSLEEIVGEISKSLILA